MSTISVGGLEHAPSIYIDELNSAALYEDLAAAERDANLAEVYRRLAAIEQAHAATWAERMRTAGVSVPSFRPSWRTRVLGWLARRFGPAWVLPSVTSLEEIGAHDLEARGTDPAMLAETQANVRLLREITQTLSGGLTGGALTQIEGRQRAVGGNALRAAVLGSNDGIVSNLSLVMGVAGAELSGETILITGLAGLLAGACSMGLGEWLSVQSSRELYRKQIAVERASLLADPVAEGEKLALIYQARGLDREQAGRLSAKIMGDRSAALETIVREKLGIDPEELGGSAWVAAITSFLLFAFGALVPVLPFIALDGREAVAGSAALSALALFVVGAGTTLFTGRGILFAGGRQTLFGLAAAALTFAIGRAIGVSIAG